MKWHAVLGVMFAGVSCRPGASEPGSADDPTRLGPADAGEPTPSHLPWPGFEPIAAAPYEPFPRQPAQMLDGTASALPLCTGYPAVALPSPLVNFSMLTSNGPTAHEGSATVTAVRRDATGLPFAAQFEWTDSEGSISLANSGTFFPDLAVGQLVHVNMLATSTGIVAQSVIIISDPTSDWLLASYNFDDGFIRDGSVERLLGFDVALREICEGSSDCSQSPSRFIAGTAVIAGRETALPIGQVVDAQIDGREHKLVWRGGQDNPGPPTGNCTDVIFGRTVSFLVIRR